LNTAKVLACCLLVLPLSGIAHGSAKARRSAEVQKTKRVGDRLRLELDGVGVFRAGRYRDACQGFEANRAAAGQARETAIEGRASAEVGGCRSVLHRYQSALQSLPNARQVAAGGWRARPRCWGANLAVGDAA
jgi:hypothetical protein